MSSMSHSEFMLALKLAILTHVDHEISNQIRYLRDPETSGRAMIKIINLEAISNVVRNFPLSATPRELLKTGEISRLMEIYNDLPIEVKREIKQTENVTLGTTTYTVVVENKVVLRDTWDDPGESEIY